MVFLPHLKVFVCHIQAWHSLHFISMLFFYSVFISKIHDEIMLLKDRFKKNEYPQFFIDKCKKNYLGKFFIPKRVIHTVKKTSLFSFLVFYSLFIKGGIPVQKQNCQSV